MATSIKSTTTKQARRFSPIDLGNDKIITPIRDEAGDMEYEATYKGQVIATETSEFEACDRLNEYLYDLERGRIPEPAPAPAPASTLEILPDPEFTSAYERDEAQGYLPPRIDQLETRAIADRIGLIYVTTKADDWQVTVDLDGRIWINTPGDEEREQIAISPTQAAIVRAIFQNGSIVDQLAAYARDWESAFQAQKAAA